MTRRSREMAIVLLFAASACSTIEIAEDIRCLRGEEEVMLRVWIRPDWSASYWGMYLLIGDLLVPVVDWGVSGYWTIANLGDERVRSRCGPLFAPVGWLAAIVLPCVTSHREPMDLRRALFGLRANELFASEVELLVLAAGTDLAAAEDEFVRRISTTPEAEAIARSRIVEVEWVSTEE